MTDVATILEVMEPEPEILRGKSFSISGHLGKPRAEIIRLIESAGGVFHKSPTWGTTFLISNLDWNKGSTCSFGISRKLEAARRNGTKVITEAQFFSMLMGKN